MNIAATLWDKIFSNYISDKGFVYDIYKALSKLHSKNQKKKKSTRKIDKGHFTEDVPMANKPMKRCSTSLAVRKIQTKSTRRNHYVQNDYKTTKYWERWENLNRTNIIGGNVNWLSYLHSGKWEVSLKN